MVERNWCRTYKLLHSPNSAADILHTSLGGVTFSEWAGLGRNIFGVVGHQFLAVSIVQSLVFSLELFTVEFG
jgi:hypothetical protein